MMPKRLADFVDAHLHPVLHVAFGEDRHGELHLIVGGVRKIAAQIVIEAGGAAGDAHDAEVARDFGLEHARRFQPVARAGVDRGSARPAT